MKEDGSGYNFGITGKKRPRTYGAFHYSIDNQLILFNSQIFLNIFQ